MPFPTLPYQKPTSQTPVSIPTLSIPLKLTRRSRRKITSVITAPTLPSSREDHTPRPTILRRPLQPNVFDLKRQLHLRHPHIRVIQWRLQILNIIIKDRCIVHIRDGDRMRHARGNGQGLPFVHGRVSEGGDDVDVLPV